MNSSARIAIVKTFALALLALAISFQLDLARGQVQVSAPTWFQPGWVTLSGSVQLMRATTNVTTGAVTYSAIAGQSVPLPPLVQTAVVNGVSIPFSAIGKFDLRFPGQKTSAMQVGGVKVTIHCTGGGLAACETTYVKPIAYKAAAGTQVFLHYEASISTDPANGGFLWLGPTAYTPPK